MALKTISKQDVLDFLAKYFLKKASEINKDCRKITVYV